MFKELKEKYSWKPIIGCPGRYILSRGVVPLTIQQLVGKSIEVSEEKFENVKDPVSFCHFQGGGLISYRKKNGYLHTLCDTGGMKRKIAILKGDEET